MDYPEGPTVIPKALKSKRVAQKGESGREMVEEWSERCNTAGFEDGKGEP